MALTAEDITADINARAVLAYNKIAALNGAGLRPLERDLFLVAYRVGFIEGFKLGSKCNDSSDHV